MGKVGAIRTGLMIKGWDELFKDTAFPSFNKFRMSGNWIRFMLMAAIFRYRRPFPAYPAGGPFPLILNLLKDGRDRADANLPTYPK